jgi:hypothetical protein
VDPIFAFVCSLSGEYNERVYVTNPHSLQELKDNIPKEIASILRWLCYIPSNVLKSAGLLRNTTYIQPHSLTIINC